jgi:hypothetical protein
MLWEENLVKKLSWLIFRYPTYLTKGRGGKKGVRIADTPRCHTVKFVKTKKRLKLHHGILLTATTSYIYMLSIIVLGARKCKVSWSVQEQL